jgi:hypothetical protein
MKTLSSKAQLAYAQITGEHGIQGPVKICQAVLPFGLKTDYLAFGMDSPVSSASTDYTRGPPRNCLQSPFELALYGSPL